MRHSKFDRIISVRLNLIDQKVIRRLLRDDEFISTFIKRLIYDEYKRRTGDLDLNDILYYNLKDVLH